MRNKKQRNRTDGLQRRRRRHRQPRELIAIANAVASEKMIDRAIVIEAMEDAIQRAAKARYGAENDIRAKLDATSGDLRLWRVVEVVEAVDNYFTQVDVKVPRSCSRAP
jgi:hypothetical protein